MSDNKFKFSTEFQFDLLKYTVTDANGYKALEMYSDSYFTLTEHAVIANTLKRYYKKKKKVPGRIMLLQELNKTFELRDFVNNLTDSDRKEILRLADEMYKGKVQDGDEILEHTEKFTQFVDLKDVIERVDLLDFSQYEIFSRQVQKAISSRVKKLEERGSFLVKDILDRQLQRKESSPIVRTPFKQINRLTNAGGYVKGSILVVLDKAKKFKTGMLVNIAIGYLKLRKNVLIVDLDNGEGEFIIRVEQAITERTKSEVLSGDYDQFIYDRLYNRKGEIIVKKFPALVTTANDIKGYIQYLYREFGIKIEVLILDYIAKMGCISGKDIMHERISEAYIDIGNLALEEKIDHIWTAQHVTREAARKRMSTRYDGTDVAGAIDITRHVQAIFGLNRSALEESEGLQRMEIVDQRDGKPRGRAVFRVNFDTQKAKELSDDDLINYIKNYKDHLEKIDKQEIDTDENSNRAPGYPRRQKDDLNRADA